MERPEDEDPIEFVHVIKDKGLLAGTLPEYLGEWAVEKIKCEGVTVMPKSIRLLYLHIGIDSVSEFVLPGPIPG